MWFKSSRIRKNEQQAAARHKRRQEEAEAYEEAARIARESTLRRSTRARKPVQRHADYNQAYDWEEEEVYQPSTEVNFPRRQFFTPI